MRTKLIACIVIALVGTVVGTTVISDVSLAPQEELGKRLFFDATLSTPPGQACAACHAPEAGFTGPSSEINALGAVYPGAVHTRFGNRKPPTSAYAFF